MKTILTNAGQFIEVDFEEKTATPIHSNREAINRIYLVKEKCLVVDNQRTLEAKPGDIIVRFYDDTFTYRTVIAKSKDWAKNIKDYEDRMNKLNEQCALKSSKDSVECCDSCACEG